MNKVLSQPGEAMDDKQQPRETPEKQATPPASSTTPTPDPEVKDTTASVKVSEPTVGVESDAKPDPKPVAKPAPKAAPPKAPAVMQAVPWEGELPAALQSQFGDRLLRAATYREQDFLELEAAAVPELLETLRDEFNYDYLVEETAVDYPKDEKRFELVYVLYSFALNHRVRVKARLAEGEKMPSVVSIFASANWMEREIFDMFGVEFSGHPDLRRILMPDEWEGFPLRKDYGIIQQDSRWVRENLEIESGQ